MGYEFINEQKLASLNISHQIKSIKNSAPPKRPNISRRKNDNEFEK
jgi:hypothetical protein